MERNTGVSTRKGENDLRALWGMDQAPESLCTAPADTRIGDLSAVEEDGAPEILAVKVEIEGNVCAACEVGVWGCLAASQGRWLPLEVSIRSDIRG